MKQLYIYTTYGKVLQNMLVQHVRKPIMLHNIQVYVVLREHTHNFYNTQQYISQYINSHYTTFDCILRTSVVICYYSFVLPLILQYSIWLTVRVTVDTSSKSTIHSVTSCHTHTLAMCVIFFRVEQFIETGFCVFLQTIKLLPWHFLEIRHEDCEFCQHLARETG